MRLPLLPAVSGPRRRPAPPQQRRHAPAIPLQTAGGSAAPPPCRPRPPAGRLPGRLAPPRPHHWWLPPARPHPSCFGSAHRAEPRVWGWGRGRREEPKMAAVGGLLPPGGGGRVPFVLPSFQVGRKNRMKKGGRTKAVEITPLCGKKKLTMLCFPCTGSTDLEETGAMWLPTPGTQTAAICPVTTVVWRFLDSLNHRISGIGRNPPSNEPPGSMRHHSKFKANV